MTSIGDDRWLAAPDATAGSARPPRPDLVDQLPRVLAQDHFVRSYVGLCDEIWTSVIDHIDQLEWFLDVGVAPIAFVQWLGGWLGVAVDPHLPEDCQRALVHTAGRTLMYRGTRPRLEQLLAAVTGSTADVTDDGGVVATDDRPRASQRVSIRLASSGGVSESHLRELIRAEVPANAVVDLRIDSHHVDAVPPPQPREPDGVVAEPEPHGDEGFLPPMYGRFDGTEDSVDDSSATRPEQDPGGG